MKTRSSSLLEELNWQVGPPQPPSDTQEDDGNNRARWKRVLDAIDYQIHRMDKGNRACNDLITVKEIAKYSKESPDFARQVMNELADFSRAIKECFERL